MSRSIGPRRRAIRRPLRPALTRLEDRTVPATTPFYPTTYFLTNPNVTTNNAQLGPMNPVDIGLTYLKTHAAQLGMSPTDVNNSIVTSQYTDGGTGMTHIYLRQDVNGLPVINSDFSLSVNANGEVTSAGGGYVPNLQSNLTALSNPTISPLDAIRWGATGLGVPYRNDARLVSPRIGPLKFQTTAYAVNSQSFSVDPLNVHLEYVPTADGSAALAWGMVVQSPSGQFWGEIAVDARTGALLFDGSYVDDADYNTVPLPNESPQDGGFAILTNPASPVASPFGWHDTNGVAGPEFTDTRGNNVDVHLDRNADNVADPTPGRPDGGAALDFSGFTFNPTVAPTVVSNQMAAQVNLFYMNNRLHDIHYMYGFTEAAGNFQVNNYGNGGAGNDAVQGDAQDGSGTNNANFGTPADGSAPRMQMYLWTSTTPNRDGDFDEGVISHEFGHGVSNRLTGGPANSNALNNTQSGGMGEGWSDFYALMFTQRATDLQNSAYPMGTYVLGQAPTGGGIRRRPYSFNMTIDPLTWDAYGTTGTTSYGITRSTEVHNTGELWATTLWDMNWLLINKYGFDANLLTGWSPNPGPAHAGNKLALQLVEDGLKLQPANPSFTQARDAIIAADVADNGGKDLYEIWAAFARRGLGQGSSTPGSTSTATPTLSTTLPMLVSSVVPATTSVVTSHPTNYVVNVTAPIDPTTIQAADLTVNGQPATNVTYNPGDLFATFTFASDPVTAEGNQTMAIAGSAFNRASDASTVAAFGSNFFYDTTPLSVASISPTPNGPAPLPLTTIDVNLNQAIDPSSVQTSDLTLSQGAVTGFTLLNGNTTVRFTTANLTREQTISVSVAAGAFLDLQGNPNAVFAGGNYTLDYTTFPFPTPLQAQAPLGSMVYSGSFAANIGFVSDTDSFTLSLAPNQIANVIVTPDTVLRPTIAVNGPGTNQSASATGAGAAVQLNAIPINSAGTYTFTVGAVGSTGTYSIQVVLNQLPESELLGGGSNNTLATAQDLSSNFVNLGSGLQSVTVHGRTDVSPSATVNEVEPNGTTATATSAATYYALPNNNTYQLGISGTLSSTTDGDYFNIGQLQAGDILTISESATASGRGTGSDPLVQLYQASGGANGTLVTSDDDNGPGTDSLIYRFTITATDTYYIRAYRFSSTTTTGTYQLAAYLENSGTPPQTGGTFTTEVESNDTIATANNAANAWRPLNYFATAAGTITSGDTDIYSYQFTAGDVVTLVTHATSSTLAAQTALLNSAGAVIATENGTSGPSGAGGLSPIYGYVIPSSGTYYFRVTGGTTTGSYTADIYRSTTATPATVSLTSDLYSFTLAPGQSASVALKKLGSGAVDLSILDGTGATIAFSTVGFSNVDEFLNNFVAPTGGTYYVQVIGNANVDYQFTLTTGGTFDTEPNDTFATAQPLATGRAALGALSGNDDWYQVTLNAGDHLTVATTTPGGAPGEFSNSLDPAVALFDPSNNLLASDDNSGPDGRNAKLTFTIASGGVYRIRVSAVGGTTGEYTISASVPPKVAAVTVDDGTGQRSRVASLTIRFDQVVSLPANIADAFQLSRNGGGAVNFTATAIYQGGVTVVTLNGFTGSEADASGSLVDGRYTLTVLQNRVSATGAALDGNGDGTAGDNFVYTDAQGLFRFYGDANGDANINGFDLGIFRNAFGTQVGDANFLSYLDFDQDGVINGFDFGQFRTRFGTTLP